MGVMLCLDRPEQPARSRLPGGRRHGQHARSAEDQACRDALAACLLNDAPGAGRYLGSRYLSKVAHKVLARFPAG
jgi:hypothetical protein